MERPSKGSDEQSPILRGVEKLAQRHSDDMEGHLSHLSDNDVDDIVRYYSQLPCEIKLPVQSVQEPTGVFWCTACHILETSRRIGGVPVIHGQKPEYLFRQLVRIKANFVPLERHVDATRFHHYMSKYLRFTDEIKLRAFADYFGKLCM